MKELDQRIAIVTGAARGIGLGIVEALLAKGAIVFMSDVLKELGEANAQMLAEQGHSVRFIEHDVSDEQAWQKVFKEVLASDGRVDILVNNAGIAPPADIETVAADDFRKVLDVNLIGPLIGMQLAIKSMKKTGGGSIINVSSNSTVQVMQTTGIYSPSKAALANLTKVAAVHCARENLNIRVNSLHPGASRTPMITDQFPPDLLKALEQANPMGRLAEPIELGHVAAFLASDAASFVNGAEYFVDGGATLAQ